MAKQWSKPYTEVFVPVGIVLLVIGQGAYDIYKCSPVCGLTVATELYWLHCGLVLNVRVTFVMLY